MKIANRKIFVNYVEKSEKKEIYRKIRLDKLAFNNLNSAM